VITVTEWDRIQHYFLYIVGGMHLNGGRIGTRYVTACGKKLRGKAIKTFNAPGPATCLACIATGETK
jgi:hypothetical protein